MYCVSQASGLCICVCPNFHVCVRMIGKAARVSLSLCVFIDNVRV